MLIEEVYVDFSGNQIRRMIDVPDDWYGVTEDSQSSGGDTGSLETDSANNGAARN